MYLYTKPWFLWYTQCKISVMTIGNCVLDPNNIYCICFDVVLILDFNSICSLNKKFDVDNVQIKITVFVEDEAKLVWMKLTLEYEGKSLHKHSTSLLSKFWKATLETMKTSSAMKLTAKSSVNPRRHQVAIWLLLPVSLRTHRWLISDAFPCSKGSFLWKAH